MTFLELPDDDSRDLALELWHAADAETLDEAAALAADMQQALAGAASDWDFDMACLAIDAGDAETIGLVVSTPGEAADTALFNDLIGWIDRQLA